VDRVIVAVVLAAAAIGVALLIQRRRADVPTQPRNYDAPVQLDRSDFDRPEVPWLVVVFSSATCSTCDDVVTKAEVMASPQVVVQVVEAVRDGPLHDRYGIEAVPIAVIADSDGVVRASFVGPVSATHLWAALAEAREPGSLPGGCDAHDHR